MVSDKSIQERHFPTTTCFGCGPANPSGMHVRSYRAHDDTVVGSFTPSPDHNNGLGLVHGGVISTVLDCHSGAVVFQAAIDRGWISEHSLVVPFVTARFHVSFLRPTPLGPSVDLWAQIEQLTEQQAITNAELRFDGKTRVSMRSIWKRLNPR